MDRYITGGKYYYRMMCRSSLGSKWELHGTRANAYVMLVGDKGKIGKLSLRGYFDSVSRDTYDTLTVTTNFELGKVLVVIVGCGGSWLED